AYGSDAATILAWVAAQTERIDIGSAVFQIPARTPAMTAMTAATLDSLSNGRFRLGLGVSGPQVSEGWHGVAFKAPLGRTREYVDIVNLALSRKRVSYDGEHFKLPLPGGPGKKLQLTVHPIREHIPIYLAAVGPKNLELAGRIADGWLAVFFSPQYAGEQLAAIESGRKQVGKDLTGFDVVPPCPWWSTTTWSARPSRSAGMRPCTSAEWAAASRTSTTNSPAAWASRTRRRASKSYTWPESTATQPRPCLSS